MIVLANHFAADGIPEELLAAGDDGTGEEDGGGGLVVQLERPVIDADLVHLQEELGGGGGGAEDLGHGVRLQPVALEITRLRYAISHTRVVGYTMRMLRVDSEKRLAKR